jgi:hypothetical protein
MLSCALETWGTQCINRRPSPNPLYHTEIRIRGILKGIGKEKQNWMMRPRKIDEEKVMLHMQRSMGPVIPDLQG